MIDAMNKQTNIVDGLRIPETRNLECQVLADLIANPDMIGMVRGIVARDMFTDQSFVQAWDNLNEMIDQGTTIDISTIGTRVDRETLVELLRPTPGLTTETMDHCRALVQMATRRLVFIRCYEIMTRAGNPGTNYSELLSMPGDLVAELAGHVRTGATTQTIGDVLNEWADNLQDRATGKLTRIPTGIPKLDGVVFGGWNGGNLIVMSARPSVGKSAIMLQMAVEASRAGFPATVYSLEMPNTEIAQRLVLSTGEVRQQDIRNDEAVKHLDWTRGERAIGHFDNLPLSFNTRLQTMDEICNDIMLQHQRGRCAIAFIDHLHIIAGTNPRQTTYQQISERTRRFKLLARDCNIPVVLLCQLNRMSETENRPPDFRDLRDSGSIEQDADIVLMLSRHTNTKSDPDVDMWVRKNRQGKTDFPIELTGDVTRGFTVFYSRQRESGI